MGRKAWIVLLIDALLVNFCILAIFSIRFFGDMPPTRNINAYRNTAVFITMIYVVLFYLQGLYDLDENDDEVSVVFKALSSISLGTVCAVALTFLSREFAFPRTVFFMSWVASCFVFGVWRLVLHQRLIAGLPPRRTLVFGDEGRAKEIEKIMSQQRRPRFLYGGHVSGWDFEALRAAIAAGDAQAVIVTDGIPNAHETAFDIYLRNRNTTVYLMPQVYDIIAGARFHVILGDMPLICLSEKAIAGRYFLLKRLIDLLVCGVGSIVLSPVFLVVAALVKLTSKGPVFYSQERVGLNGKEFKIVKFRTMVTDAEVASGPMLSLGEEDPRVTKVGRILRKTKLDELPQFINVLRGEMSLVGPRPERPNFVVEYERDIPGFSERTRVLPGITGLAQVSGWYETDAGVKLKYDLIYIYNYSPYLDLVVMYNTLQHVLRANL